MRRILILILLLSAAPGVLAGPDDDGERVTDKQRRAAARKAVAWLDDNLLRLPESQGTPKKPFTYATAGLVYLMSPDSRTGESPLPRIVEYLDRWVEASAERVADPESLPPEMGRFSSQYLIQYTWPLAQSALFFAELHERGQHMEKARRSLARIVAMLEAAQDPSGGWGHHQVAPRETPESSADSRIPERFRGAGGGYPSTLVSSSSTVASALGVVQAALGVRTVSGMDEARRYFREAKLENGNFPYDPSQRSSGQSMIGVSRTGGALLAMYWLGVPRSDPDLDGSLEFIGKNFGYLAEAHGSPALNLMQSAWALKLLDAKAWARFGEDYYPRLVAHQAEDGALSCVCEAKAFGTTCDSRGFGGRMLARGEAAYVTALHAFILLLPEDRLKIAKNKPKPARRAARTERSGRRGR